jgi:hypothetical protein
VRSLAQLIGEQIPKIEPSIDPFLATFGLARNPFPPARTIIPQILYDQQDAIEKFASAVREILQSEPQRRSIGIIGGTGGGKTHFLRHCQFLVTEFGQRVDARLLL